MKKIVALILVFILLLSLSVIASAEEQFYPFEDLNGTDVSAQNNNTSKYSRAIMQPYADVFSDSGLGHKIGQLKQYDLVQVISYLNGSVVKVLIPIQSGNGVITPISSIYSSYSSPDDILMVGFIRADALERPKNGTEKDIQRDVVGLAYSRLGMKGIYSQDKRFSLWYTDCSALASYCWYQVGYDFADGGWCNTDGIASWARGHNAVLWRAQGDASLVYQTYDNLYFESGNNEVTSDNENQSVVKTSEELVVLTKTFSPNIFEEMEPGDVMLFSWGREVTTNDQQSFTTHYINPNAGVMTYDHAAIFVGYNPDTGTATYIESSHASANPNENTKLTTITTSSDILYDITMIVRPTGCEEDTTSGNTAINPNYLVFNTLSISQNQIIVVFKEDVTEEEMNAALSQIEGATNRPITASEQNALMSSFNMRTEISHAFVLTFDASSDEDAMKEYQSQIKENELVKEAYYNPVMMGGDGVTGVNGFAWPGDHHYLSGSNFGPRIHPITGQAGFHTGVDIAGNYMDPIYASKSGVVSSLNGYGAAYGNHVAIDHGDGYVTLYAHMTYYIVSVGQNVQQGQVIGYVGSTGYSTGPHIHFGIYYNGSPVNPMNFLPH